jgi:hypothetical protein
MDTVANGNVVVVLGEMVAVLWAQKKYEAPIRLKGFVEWTCVDKLLLSLLCLSSQCISRGGGTCHYAETLSAQHSHVVSEFEGLRNPA